MFYLDGISNIQLGLIVEEETFLARAPLLYDEINIDGMDGACFNEKKYGNVVRSMNVYFTKEKYIDKILQLLSGTHTLTYKDRKTTIHFYDIIEINRYGSIKTATVNFIRAPFWISKHDNKISPTKYIRNDGNVYAKPIIELYGVGIEKC